MGGRVQGLGFRVQGFLGFGVEDSGFRALSAWGLGVSG